MAESTTATFGSNAHVLSKGNPIIFGTTNGGKAAIVDKVSATGPTHIVYLDTDNETVATKYDNGGADIPNDGLATGADDTRAGYWIPIKAPPVR